MRYLSLFSGIGGLDLGLDRAGWTCVGQCEANPFCRAVLAKHWPDVRRWDDVRTLKGSDVGSIDAICGGFPCQDISVAGKGAGIDGERSGLWSEMFRLVRELRPAWILGENVPALRTRGADRVLGDLEGEGYACGADVVGACDAGAPHKRQRVFIVARLADAEGRGWPGERKRRQSQVAGPGSNSPRWRDVADTRRAGCEELDAPAFAAKAGHDTGRDASQWRWPARPGEEQHEWEEPRLAQPAMREVGRGERESEDGTSKRCRKGSDNPKSEQPMGSTADGVSTRLVRSANRHALKAAGNAVVPAVAEVIGRAIIEADLAMRKAVAA